MRTKLTILAALVIAATPTCARDTPTVDASPSGSVPSPNPGAPPSGPPLSTVTLATGTASVMTSGDLEADASADMLVSPAIYQTLPGDVAVDWGGLLIISGPLHLGAQTSIGGLAVSLEVPAFGDGPGARFVSSVGECIVTVDAADERSFSGSFTCGGLTESGGDLTVDASGTFAASS